MNYLNQFVLACLVVFGNPAAWAAPEPAKPVLEPMTVDFRYAPAWWQTSICLPDDWQKTLVGKEGALLYDYPGQFNGFATRIAAGALGSTGPVEWVRQELVSPRVPIVRTIKRLGALEIVEESFAVAPVLKQPPKKGTNAVLEVVGQITRQQNWAAPSPEVDPAFRNVAIGWNKAIQYRLKYSGKQRLTVMFGLCEGFHQQAGKRILNLQIEGQTRKTIDMAANYGKNIPALFAFDAVDLNQDGWLDIAVAAAPQSSDANTILNVLWVFAGTNAPLNTELMAGRSSQAALVHLDCGKTAVPTGSPRHDLTLIRYRNTGKEELQITPTITVDSTQPMKLEGEKQRLLLDDQGALFLPQVWQNAQLLTNRAILSFAPLTIPAGKERRWAMGVARGPDALTLLPRLDRASRYREMAEDFWQSADLPYNHITVPDQGVQAQLDSSIRNIYQAREIKNGLPAFQVGPTCYRGLWVVDGSFLMEAVAYLGRTQEARNGIQYLLGFQREDGGFMLIDGHWKETGIVLWAVTRHARLTGDKAWLREVWPKLERGVAYIRTLRQQASANPQALNAGLIPDGFSDGGLGESKPEYTNIYWTQAGLRAAVEAAHWLENEAQAREWQRDYEDFMAIYRQAAKRDQKTDARGNLYVPIRMKDQGQIAPQRAQWAFMHAIFPGKVFTPDDPQVQGTMRMLEAVEREGLVYGTGWLEKGLWNYFGSFYAHAWLWLGRGQKAAQTLYAFANHASPLLCWREEQMPFGQGGEICGDMPHNWASAEFIRLVRHLLVLERGQELHLFEGLPRAWIQPKATIRLHNIPTDFGPMSLELKVRSDGRSALLRFTPPQRNPPAKVILHLDDWSGAPGTLVLPTGNFTQKVIPLVRK